ncbi:mannose-1-phosphate guanylyltransferase, partial [Patescibacteria group bacterium]|nr:mannose-1-phosphate guanylyltransferase [Patescibacteria group bacterium]
SEKAKNFYMVVGDFGWDDVGDWKNVYDLVKKDKNGNAVLKFGTDKGEFIGIEAKNNLVQFDDQLIALVGVEDLVVVDAGDIVLVCRKDRAQDVKKMVNFLKEKKKEEYL